MSITQVGLACGFRSASHFSKCYRKAFGTAPSRDAGDAPMVSRTVKSDMRVS